MLIRNAWLPPPTSLPLNVLFDRVLLLLWSPQEFISNIPTSSRAVAGMDYNSNVLRNNLGKYEERHITNTGAAVAANAGAGISNNSSTTRNPSYTCANHGRVKIRDKIVIAIDLKPVTQTSLIRLTSLWVA